MKSEYKRGLVSIGFPVYNGASRPERLAHGAGMRRALESLLNQTYQNTEIIISDNASTDDTEKICREYATRDPRIRYVRQKDNIHVVPNIEFVMRSARGEYFMLGADDDWWHPKFIEKLKYVLDVHSDYGVAMSSMRLIRSDGVVIKDVLNTGEHDHTHRSFGQVFSTMSKRGSIHYILGLYRTRILHDLLWQPFLSSTRPDRVLLCELSLFAKIYSLPEVLYHRTIHNIPSHERYRADPFGVAYRDSRAHTKFVLAVIRRILVSRNIPLMRKITLFPFLIPKFLWTWRKALMQELL